MKKTLSVGIDELTLVLSADKAGIERLEDWQPKAEGMVAEFERRAGLESIFGKRKGLEGRCPQGYSVAYQYGDNPFYFAAAYHPLHPQMGVAVKFSAYSWAAYCQKGHTDIRGFLHAVQSGSYSIRLSRIDFTADYQNWAISVDGIYQSLVGKRLEIHDYRGMKNLSAVSALEVDGAASTFYVGSRKAGTRLFMRVYDKKMEQVATRGFRCREAAGTLSWVRFEVVFKGSYAHQLTDIIMDTGEGKLKDLIADKITEKFRFYDTAAGKYTDFSQALFESPQRQSRRLRLESPRDNDLVSSLLHLANGSGLFPALYKCDKVWGEGASTLLLKRLHGIYADEYEPNEDVLLWLKKHKGALEGQPLDEMLGTLKALRDGKPEKNLLPGRPPENAFRPFQKGGFTE